MRPTEVLAAAARVRKPGEVNSAVCGLDDQLALARAAAEVLRLHRTGSSRSARVLAESYAEEFASVEQRNSATENFPSSPIPSVKP
jgi:hypothetical protein